MIAKNQHKIENKLNLLENELVVELLSLLPSAAKTGSDLFSPHQFNPNKELISGLRLKSEHCCELRNQLILDSHNSPGELYLRAYNEACDVNNEHRRGPKRLAEWLLSEIKGLNVL